MDPQIEKDMSEITFASKKFSGHDFGLILLTGASGMLGGYILESLVVLSKLKIIDLDRIIVPVRNKSIYLDNLEKNNKNLIKIIKDSEISSHLEEYMFNTIFHFSSPSSISKIQIDLVSVFETNFLLTVEFCSHLSKTKGKIFFASTGEVYGSSPRIPTSENDYSAFSHLETAGLYAEAKKAAESYLYAHSQKFEYDAFSLRIFHTFGPGLHLQDPRIFGQVINSLSTGIPFQWQSNGIVTRNFLYTLDLVKAILILTPLVGFNVFNIAGNKEIQMRDFVAVARDMSSLEIFPLELQDGYAEGHTKILRGSANIDKLAALGWSPTIDTTEAILRTLYSRNWRVSNNYLN
jgi:nucleoside-diphosphate-sugar epimerase